MYTFVFLWTPSLSSPGESIPHGFIFANFMLACMVGSNLAGQLMASGEEKEKETEKGKPELGKGVKVIRAVESGTLSDPEVYMKGVFLLGFLCMVLAAVLQMGTLFPSLSRSAVHSICFVAFCVFELVVGMFWPSMMRVPLSLSHTYTHTHTHTHTHKHAHT